MHILLVEVNLLPRQRDAKGVYIQNQSEPLDVMMRLTKSEAEAIKELRRTKQCTTTEIQSE